MGRQVGRRGAPHPLPQRHHRHARGAGAQLEQQRIRLLEQQNRLTQEAIRLQSALSAAQARREGTDRADVAGYERANDAVNELSQALAKNNQAMDANAANIRENSQQADRTASQFRELTSAAGRMEAQFVQLRQIGSSNIFVAMTRQMQNFNKQIMEVAQALQGRLVAAISRAASAMRQFVAMSGGAMFAGLQRSLQGIGNGFTRFADNVVNSMERARHSMMEFYAAGYSLMMMGSQLQQFGLNINREMGRSLESYMQYEAARNQAAIAGAEAVYQDGSRGLEGNWQSGIASYDINTEIVDRIIRGMQYGTYTPEWLNPSGKPMPVAFDAKELAQGLYYYSSAIGVPITSQNEREVAGVMTTIMQAAKVTNTGIESATKGTMNVAMEFGYDPRDLSPENAEAISSITARMAYLANISTMEMTDIVETFKMVGPQAHFLSPGGLEGQPGAGLDETFLLAFLASEVGLRGGNVGRGINQAFTSLLDPTEKMLEVAGKHFGDGGKWTEEQFNEFFKEDGHLKGGITGFLRTLQEIPREAQATMLAELFTSNATRSLMGPVLAGADFDIERFLTEMEENPFIWLEAAVAETANSVNGWFQFMKNGWFQFTRSIIDSISGPLMGGFEGIGTFLFEWAEALTQFPQLGRMIAGFVTALGSLSVVAGTALMAAGGILVLGRAFAMLGGYIVPAMRMMAFAGVTLLGLVPLLLGVAVAAGVLRGLWTTNFMGMREAFENFTEGMDLRNTMNSVVQGMARGMIRITQVIGEFSTGILLAHGPVNNLFKAMTSLFGPKLGSVVIAGLMQLREHMRGVRQDFEDMIDGVAVSGNVFQDLGLSIQGFLETLMLGSARAEAVEAMDRIGEIFGQSNFSANIMGAARAFGDFVSQAIAYGRVLVDTWTGLMGQIYDNIVRIFSGRGMEGIFDGLGSVMEGVFTGMITVITGVLTVIERVTGAIADMSESLRNAGSAGKEILGFVVTFDGVMKALGVTIGLVLGARLLLMFSPLAMMFARMIPMVTAFASVIVGLAGRFIVLAAQIGITVAAWAAQLAVIVMVQAAKLGLAAANAVLATSEAGAASSGGVLAGVLAAVSGGAMTAAGASAFLATSLGAVVVAVGAVVLGFAGVFVGLAAVAGGFTLLAGAGIAVVTITQGVGAGLSALGSFLAGVWMGIQPVVVAFAALISISMEVVGALGILLGVGDSFQAMGLMVGAALAGMAAMLLAVAAAAAVAFAPFVLLGVAVAGLALAFAVALNDAGTFAGAFYLVFEGLATSIASVMDFIVNDVFISGFEFMLQSAADAAGGFEDIFNTLMGRYEAAGIIGDGDKVDLPRADFTDGLIADLEAMRPVVESSGILDGTAYKDGFLAGLSDTEFGTMINEWLEPMGTSLEDLDPTKLTQIVNDMVKMPANIDKMADVDWTPLLGPKAEEYQKALDEWNQYNDLVKSRGKAFADEFYEAQGWEIPTAPDLSEYMESAEDMEDAAMTFEKASEQWLSAVENLNNLTVPEKLGMLFDPMAGEGGKSMIGFVAGIGDTIIEAAKSGGAGEWLNMDELLADVAGSGVKLDENIAGRNIHKALAPALQIISDQTGVAMETLLADIPKFYAPEEFLSSATVDMVQGIAGFRAEYGDALYRELDLLGQDFILPDGSQAEQWGLDWAELNQYAIGQAIAGTDWNLADYIAESWDISVADAEKYLIGKGIDPNAVSSAWYDGVEEAVLSNAGAFNALTTQQYEWLEDATNGFTTNVIGMTRDAWLGMSDTQKQILTQMGYNFVVDDIIPQEALSNAQSAIQEFADVLGGQGVDFPTEIAGMKEWAASWTEVERYTDEAGTKMVTLQDSLGNQITVPAVVYDEFIRSLDLVSHHAEEAKRRYDEIREKFKSEPLKMTGATAGTALDIASTGLGSGEQAVSEFLGFSLPDVTEFTSQVTSEVTQAFTQGVQDADISAALTTELEGIDLKVKVGVDPAQFNSDIRSMDAGLRALTLVEYRFNLRINVEQFNSDIRSMDAGLRALALVEYKLNVRADAAQFNADIRSMDAGLRALGLVEYKVKVGIDTSSFAAGLAGLTLSTSLIPPIKVKVQPDLSGFWSSISTGTAVGNRVAGPATQAVKIPVTGQITGFENSVQGREMTVQVAAIIARFGTADGLSAHTVEVTANVTKVNVPASTPPMNATANVTKVNVPATTPAMNATANVTKIVMPASTPALEVTATISQVGGDVVGQLISGLIALAGVFAVTWTATLAQSGGGGVGQTISGLIALGDQFAKTYTATLAQSGGGGVSQTISGLIALLDEYAGTYTATLSVSDGASGTLNNVLSLLESVDGFNATSTVTTNVVTRTQTVNLGTVAAGALAARGGRIGSAAMDRRKTDDIWSYPGLTARALGGRVRPYEYTLVGENGPEIVKLPEGAYVHHATETANMLRRTADTSLALSTPTNHLAAGTGGGTMVINNNNTREGDTYNFGDVIIQAPDAASGQAAVDRFFEQVDRRAGHKQELAKRGMVPMNDPRFW